MDILKDFKSLDKFSILYKWSRSIFDIFLRIFYRKFIVHGLENLPKNKAYIIASNHQNALMDPLVVMKSLERPVFISRADLFKTKNLLSRFFVFCRIIPSFRIRDGKETLKFNHDMFLRVSQILQNNVPLVIFPEAQHFDKRHLLPLKKGITRMAFTTEVNCDFKLDLQIIPAGIYYSNYFNFQADVKIILGKPINVLKYKQLFLENEARANAELRDEIANELKKCIIHIEDLNNYTAYEMLRVVNRTKMLKDLRLENKGVNDLFADQATIKLIEEAHKKNTEKTQELFDTATQYAENLKKYALRNWLFEKGKFNQFALIGHFFAFFILFPLFLYGFLNNLLALQPQRILNKKFKDPQFHSSVRFVFFTFATPFIHLAQFGLIALITDSWWIKWVYLISLLPSGYFAYYYYTFWTKFKAKQRFESLKKTNKEVFNNLQTMRTALIDKISEISIKSA